MADYNSKWTGVDIDNAVEKSQHIFEYKLVYDAGSSGYNGSLPIDNISVNPDTGDRTGTYVFLFGQNNTGSMILQDTSINATSSISQGWYDTATNKIKLKRVFFNKDDASFHFFQDEIDFDNLSNNSLNQSVAVYKIYRMQTVQV